MITREFVLPIVFIMCNLMSSDISFWQSNGKIKHGVSVIHLHMKYTAFGWISRPQCVTSCNRLSLCKQLFTMWGLSLLTNTCVNRFQFDKPMTFFFTHTIFVYIQCPFMLLKLIWAPRFLFCIIRLKVILQISFRNLPGGHELTCNWQSQV